MTDEKTVKRNAKGQRENEKQAREIKKLERELARPQGTGYLWYLVFIVTVVYLTDEIASQINNLMGSVVAQQLFAPVFGSELAVARMGLFGIITGIGGLLSFLYKPLSDRYGRKPFLIINTLGMGLGMLLISLASGIPVYIMGALVMAFFIPHDVQMLYIFESMPAKYRATLYSVIKAAVTLGVMVVPVLRNVVMGPDITRWHYVYLIPGLIGVAAAVVAAIGLRETEPFMRRRLAWLCQSDEERAAAKADKSAAASQGGLGPAIRLCFRSKQLRWLLIGGGIIMGGMLITTSYEAVMSQGYMSRLIAAGMDMGAARTAVVPLINQGLILFPVGSAIFMALQGPISDKLGRKTAIAVLSGCTIVFYILFFFGANNGWSPYLMGFLSGSAIGSFWSVMDNAGGIMCSESAPTNLRASVMAVQPLACAIPGLITGITATILINILGDAYVGIVNLCLSIPCILAGLIILLTKTHETKQTDLNAVTGDE